MRIRKEKKRRKVLSGWDNLLTLAFELALGLLLLDDGLSRKGLPVRPDVSAAADRIGIVGGRRGADGGWTEEVALDGGYGLGDQLPRRRVHWLRMLLLHRLRRRGVVVNRAAGVGHGQYSKSGRELGRPSLVPTHVFLIILCLTPHILYICCILTIK